MTTPSGGGRPKSGPPKKTSPTGEAVRRAREAMEWSQERLAKAAGVSRPTIARIETGNTDWMRPDTLAAVARAVGLSEEEIRQGRPQFADPLEAVEAYLKSPYASIDQPDEAELQWLRSLPPLVWSGQGQPDPRAVSKILEFHRLRIKRQQ